MASPEEGKSGPHLRLKPCPSCNNGKRDGSITINTETGLWSCFKCGAKGGWFRLSGLYGHPIQDPYIDPPTVDFSVYEKIRARLRRPVSAGHYPKLLEYCSGRGITPATLDAWRVTTKGPDSIRFPLYAWVETGWAIANARIRQCLNGSPDKARDWFEVRGGPTCIAIGNHLLGQDTFKLSEHERWYTEWLSPLDTDGSDETRVKRDFRRVKRVLVVEGQWDAMTAYQLGIPNVLSVPSGASNIDVGGLLRYVPDGAEVWLAVDMDEAGDRAAEAFYSQLDGAVRRLIMPTKDLNEWLIAKPDLRAEDVLATVSEVVTKSEQEDEEESLSIDLNATDLIVTDPVIVCRTPWDGLTRRLDGGFRQGGTTGILAPSGIGKTTIANNLIAQALAEGVKVAAVQLEGTKSDIISKLRKTILEWNANIDFPELQGKLLSNLRLANMFGKDVAIERTIKFFRQMAKSGHRFLVIDNWDFLTGDGPDGLRKKAKAYSDLLEICKEYNAHAITVWQPKKVDRKEKVNSGHQKGFSTALQDADNYLTVNAEGRLRKIEVEKARVPERDGVPSSVWLKFDPDRMILEQIANPGGLHEITKGPTDL